MKSTYVPAQGIGVPAKLRVAIDDNEDVVLIIRKHQSVGINPVQSGFIIDQLTWAGYNAFNGPQGIKSGSFMEGWVGREWERCEKEYNETTRNITFSARLSQEELKGITRGIVPEVLKDAAEFNLRSKGSPE